MPGAPSDPTIYETDAGTIALTPEEIAARQAGGTLEGAPVLDEELGAAYRGRVQEQIHGGAGGIAATALERGAAGATLGLSDILGSAISPEWAENAAARQIVNPGTVVAAEVGGALGASILTGGAGAAGAAARLTPQGLLTRGAARILAEGGETVAGKIGAAALAGGFEGAATGAANYLGQNALHDREFSAQALLDQMALGGVLGAGAGAAISGLSSGAAALVGKQHRGAAALARELEQASEKRVAGLADELAGTGAGKGRVKYSDLIPPAEQTEAKAGEYLSGMLRAVDDAGARRTVIAREVKDILGALPDEAAAPLRAEVTSALAQHNQAVAGAKKWAGGLTKTLTPEQLRTGNTPALLGDDAGAAVTALASLDDATAELEMTMARLRTAAGRPDPAAVAAQQQAQQAAGAVSLPAPEALPQSPWKAFADRAAAAAGAYETAGDLGAPLPSLGNIPVIGPALELYAKYKAARSGLGALMGKTLPATPAAAAAARVNQMRQRMTAAAERVFATATPALPAVAKGGIRAARSAEEIRSLAENPDAIRASVAAQLAGLPQELRKGAEEAAVKRVQYLAERAPKPPFAGSPYAPASWKPSTAQAREWAERAWSAENPAAAIEHLLSGARSPTVAQTVRDLSPALWDAARQELAGRVEEIAKLVPRGKRLALGASFDLPLDGQLWPGYQRVPETPPQQAQQNTTFGQPPAQSRQADLAKTPTERRMS